MTETIDQGPDSGMIPGLAVDWFRVTETREETEPEADRLDAEATIGEPLAAETNSRKLQTDKEEQQWM